MSRRVSTTAISLPDSSNTGSASTARYKRWRGAELASSTSFSGIARRTPRFGRVFERVYNLGDLPVMAGCHQIGQALGAAFHRSPPVVARAHHLGGRNIGQTLAGLVPDQHPLFRVEHERRYDQVLHQGNCERHVLLVKSERPGDLRNGGFRHERFPFPAEAGQLTGATAYRKQCAAGERGHGHVSGTASFVRNHLAARLDLTRRCSSGLANACYAVPVEHDAQDFLQIDRRLQALQIADAASAKKDQQAGRKLSGR